MQFTCFLDEIEPSVALKDAVSAEGQAYVKGEDLAGIPGVVPETEYLVYSVRDVQNRLGVLLSDSPLRTEQIFEQRLELVRQHFLNEVSELKRQCEERDASIMDSMQAMTDLYEELSALYDLSKLTSKKIVTFYDVDRLLAEILHLISESELFQAKSIMITVFDDSLSVKKIASWDKSMGEISEIAVTQPEWRTFAGLVSLSVEKKHSFMFPDEVFMLEENQEFPDFPVLIEPLFSTEGKGLGALIVCRQDQNFNEKVRNFLNVIGSQVSLIISLGNTFQEILKKKKIERELELAAEIQKKLLPRKQPFVMGWDIFGRMHTARVVGGDYFDYFLDNDGFLSIVIADVSGKGISAALVMATFRGILRTLFPEIPDLKTIAERLNASLKDDVEGEKFVTLFFLKIELATGKTWFVKAGHNPPVFVKGANKEISNLEAPGLFLGMFDDLMIEVKEMEFNTGDALLLYTDGATELVNPENEEFGLEKLVDYFVSSLDDSNVVQILDRIMNEVNQFRGNLDWFDDITLIGIRRTEYLTKSFRIKSTYDDLNNFSQALVKELAECTELAVTREDLLNIRLIIDELATNAIQHGNKMNPKASIEINCDMDCRGISISVRDEGEGFSWREEMRQAQVINLMKTRGRGILICMNISENFSYNEPGNEARLTIFWRDYEKDITGR